MKYYELDDNAKETALSDYMDSDINADWHINAIDNLQSLVYPVFDIHSIQFDLSSMQFSCKGEFAYTQGHDRSLPIAEKLCDLLDCKRISFTIHAPAAGPRIPYMYAGTVFLYDDNSGYETLDDMEISDETYNKAQQLCEEIIEYLKDYSLQIEYDYLLSEDCAIDFFNANNIDFNAQGCAL